MCDKFERYGVTEVNRGQPYRGLISEPSRDEAGSVGVGAGVTSDEYRGGYLNTIPIPDTIVCDGETELHVHSHSLLLFTAHKPREWERIFMGSTGSLPRELRLELGL